jgi:MFS family permease
VQRERRDIGLLAGGTLVSVAGDSAALIALLFELKKHGVGWVSAALGAELLPFVLFASMSGRIVDRYDNRRLLVVALTGQALVAVPLAFVRTPWMVIALFFALNTLATFNRPAANAMVPVLSGNMDPTKGFAWVATGAGIGWIVGPAVGGIITATAGVTAAIGIDAASFLVVAAACAALSLTRGAEPAENAHEVERHGGWRILRRDTILFLSIVTTAIAVACAVVDNVAAPFRFLDQLATSPTGYGGYLALWGVGGILGSQIPRRLEGSRLPVALAVGNGVSGLGIVGIGLAPSLGVALAASAVGGIGNGVANVALSGLVAARVAPPERGRAFATVGAIVQSGVGVGTVAGAPLVATAGAGRAMIGAGALAAVLSALTAAAVSRRPR